MHVPSPELWFEPWWTAYVDIAPQAAEIRQALSPRGDLLSMDHVAVRTPGLGGFDVASLEPWILAGGYVESGRYNFSQKGLRAASYSHHGGKLPRLFVSELDTARLTARVRALLESCVQTQHGTCAEHLWGEARWAPVTASVYDELLEVSEYAAWVGAFGICVNHFTFGFDQFDEMRDLCDLCARLRSHGYALNGDDRPIQGGPDIGLEQCSTVAQLISHTFGCGMKRLVRSCYVEFARRYEAKDGARFDGFVPEQADVIFESTDMNR